MTEPWYVYRPPLTIVGLEAQTSAALERDTATARIPTLWRRVALDREGERIPHRVEPGALAVAYYDYRGDDPGGYSVVVGALVEPVGLTPDGMVDRRLPASYCRRFILEDATPASVAAGWARIRQYFITDQVDARRAFTADLEFHPGDRAIQPTIDVAVAGVPHHGLSYLLRLFGHLSWADRLALASLRNAVHLEEKTLGLFAHVLAAEHIWLTRLQGTPPEVAVWPALSLDACGGLAARNDEGFGRFLSRLTPESLAGEVSYVNSAGDRFISNLEDVLLHVALHGIYHRGQVAQALRLHSDVPRATDYIGFVRGAAAATRR